MYVCRMYVRKKKVVCVTETKRQKGPWLIWKAAMFAQSLNRWYYDSMQEVICFIETRRYSLTPANDNT